MQNLELKLNILHKRTEATIKHDISAAAFSAATYLEQGEERKAAYALIQGLSLIREIDGQDFPLNAMADGQKRRQVHQLLRNVQLPEARQHGAPRKAGDAAQLVDLIMQGDFEEVIDKMFAILRSLTVASSSPQPRPDFLPEKLQQTPERASRHSASPSPSPQSASDCTTEPSPSPAKSEGLSDQATENEDADEDDDDDEEDENEENEEDVVVSRDSSSPGSRRRLLYTACAVCVTAVVATQVSETLFGA